MYDLETYWKKNILNQVFFDELPVLFSSQSIEPQGHRPESSATDFPLICWSKKC